jgi:uncharacterized metal-binding protein
MLVISHSRGRLSAQERMPLDITSPLSLVPILRSRRVDAVVCGGISPQTRSAMESANIKIVDNVACSVDEVLSAITGGRLRSGYGFGAEPPAAMSALSPARQQQEMIGLNCLTCRDRVCMQGKRCEAAPVRPTASLPSEVQGMLEAATDISSEDERQLCRLAELVYFCLEMQFKRVGIAFCEELREPAEILCSVLDRSFETVPVGCKVGGPPLTGDPFLPPITCNPIAQAEALNRIGTDLNVIVGLCMGADCVFTMESSAPVTTLFVKDRSLANNPIGAVYSEYHLRESVTTTHPWPASNRLSETNAAREETS